MRTKNIILTTLLSFFAIALVAQISPKQEKADKHFNNYSYSKAINIYLSINDKDIDVKRNLAESYYHLSQFEKAQEWYNQVVNTSGYNPDDAYRYAYMLRINQNYPESENWLNKYYDLNSSDSRAVQAKNNINSYTKLQKDKRQFIIKNLKMNGSSEEFGPSYYKDEVVFASSRGVASAINRNWNGNNFPFLDFYKGTVGENLELTNIKPFAKRKNKKWHEGPVSFNEEGTFMAYTRNNYKSKSAEGAIKLMLFTSEFVDGKWSEGKPMAFNSPEYSVGHASLSADGNTMYFASDMPGGFGSIDIYKVTRSGDTWSEPMNLGSKINTEGREMFPFIGQKQNVVFFSSDGLYGLGGLDLFMTSVNGNSFGNPKNMGFPINGSYDDFAMIIDKDFQSGYFSSNRVDGHGSDDIYSFKMIKPFCKQLRGTAIDNQTLSAIEGVTVNLYNKDGDVVESVETGIDGKFEFCIDDKETYALKGSKDSYSDGKNSANMNTDAPEVLSDLMLGKASEFMLYDYVSDNITGESLSGVKATMTACDGSWQEVFYTSADGDFTKNLNNKLNDQACFNVKYEKDGYETKDIRYNFVLDHTGQYNINEKLARSSSSFNSNTLVNNESSSNIDGNNINSSNGSNTNGNGSNSNSNGFNTNEKNSNNNGVNGSSNINSGGSSSTSNNSNLNSGGNGNGSSSNSNGSNNSNSTNGSNGIWENSNLGEGSGEIVINPIYFNLDKYNIRPDAKIELDKIVRLMTQYPNLTIELSSHTDCRASKKYNQVLSANRAKASLKYIRDRISNPSRIYGEGYGESRLANDCVCEPTNNSNCSDAQHQENRRTEFVIVSQ